MASFKDHQGSNSYGAQESRKLRERSGTIKAIGISELKLLASYLIWFPQATLESPNIGRLTSCWQSSESVKGASRRLSLKAFEDVSTYSQLWGAFLPPLSQLPSQKGTKGCCPQAPFLSGITFTTYDTLTTSSDRASLLIEDILKELMRIYMMWMRAWRGEKDYGVSTQ
jgi:hypothetical protein